LCSLKGSSSRSISHAVHRILQLTIVVVINTINFIQHKLQQLISLNRAQEMGKEVLDGLAEKSGEAYEKDS
jgi:hypothetical protein